MPQQRGELTPGQVERLARAMQAFEDAQRERELAVADALKAGASVREVAAFTGLSTATVQKYGHMNGWPTRAQKQQRADDKAERERWRRNLLGDIDL